MEMIEKSSISHAAKIHLRRFLRDSSRILLLLINIIRNLLSKGQIVCYINYVTLSFLWKMCRC